MLDLKMYQSLQQEYINECKTDKENKKVRLESKVLDKLRLYLDSCNYRMPRKKYFYAIYDETTWKYLDSKVQKKNGDLIVHQVLNPTFKYAGR